MRYITNIINKYAHGLIFALLVTLIWTALLTTFWCDAQKQQQTTDLIINNLQWEKSTLQQENATLRAEIDRIREESSRGGSRRMMEITYYTDDPDENGGYEGLSSSGTQLTVGRTIAANNLPFGTKVFIQGIGWRVVEDRGNLEDNQIDVLVETKKEAYERGKHMAAVVVER